MRRSCERESAREIGYSSIEKGVVTLGATPFGLMTLSVIGLIVTFSTNIPRHSTILSIKFSTGILSTVLLSVTFLLLCCVLTCHTECDYAECHYAIAIMLIIVTLSVIMLIIVTLSAIMLSVVLLSTIMLKVIILSVVMLNVVLLSAFNSESHYAECRNT
jgi:hypothetical protein